jgi:O-antigen/teichoic acid export membrane protein
MPSSITEQVQALRRSRVGIGVLASYANTGTSFLCNFLVVPIYLKYLGRDDYGLWITVSGLVAYLALLNLGIAQTTANHLGEAVARNDKERQSHILSTGFWFFTAVALTAELAAVLGAPWLPWHLLVKGQTQLSDTAKLVLIILPTTFLLELPLTLFSACLRNIGKIHLQQAMAALQSVAKVVVSFLYLSSGGGLTGLILALSATNILCYLGTYALLRKHLPGLSVGLRYFDRMLCRQMVVPSFFFLVLQLSGAIAFGTDAVVISARLGVEQVAPYAVAQRGVFQIVALISAISTNFGPLFLEAYSRRAASELRRLFKRAMLLSVGIGSLASVALLVAGPILIRLWIGKENYVGFFPYAMLVAWCFFQMVLYPCDSLLILTGNHRVYAIFAFWEAVLNLGLSISLAPILGVGGVALGTLIARLLGSGPVMLLQSLKVIKTLSTSSCKVDHHF